MFYVGDFRVTDWDDEEHRTAKAVAALRGESLNDYVKRAVRELNAREERSPTAIGARLRKLKNKK